MSADATGTRPDFAAYEAKYQAAAALAAEVHPNNKATLFGALAAMGIHTVVVTFDGAGDSGQIESINGFDAANNAVGLPDESISFKVVQFESLAVACEQHTAREIIEAMTFDFLEQTHDGWEDQDGAYGTFTFSVGERTISLEYNERYIMTNYHEHEF